MDAPNGKSRLEVAFLEDAKTLSITGEKIQVKSEFPRPYCRPSAPPQNHWVHRKHDERPMVLAGHEGKVIQDTFSGAGFELMRETWIENDGAAVATRVRVRNQGTGPIKLDALQPLRCVGPESLLIDGNSAGQWDMAVQLRMKNEIPTSLRPGCFDPDYAHAVQGTAETGETIGADGNTTRIEIDSFCVIRAQGDEESPLLLIGYLSQIGHLARFLFKTDQQRKALEYFTADCEFDGCLVPRGGVRISQWVFIQVMNDHEELVSDFADRVGNHHGVKTPPRNAPSVFCSWYFYASSFTETNLKEELDYLKEDRLPFDVILIDGGWAKCFGDWWPSEDWADGMKAAADRIRALGYQPGIWTCPGRVAVTAELAESHPDWLLRLEDGSLQTAPAWMGPSYVPDPTFPGVCDSIEELYRRLTADWGFTYHKLDFLRLIFREKSSAFYNPSVTRLEAYRMLLEAVRRGIGPDAYLSVCGGHYGGSLGIADSQRSGSDVRSRWNNPPYMPMFKQNIHRAWMSRLWHVDPDAMMVRRRETPFREGLEISLGQFTDDEARTVALNQYLGGGMVCFTERFPELDDDRKSLYRHMVPSVNSPAIPLDPFSPVCPSQHLTRVIPVCKELAPWVTLSVVNWGDDAKEFSVSLSEKILAGMKSDKYFVFEFFDQRALGIFKPGAVLDLGAIRPHAARLLKIMPWREAAPSLAATDLHFSAGGVEIAQWRTENDSVKGRIETRWNYPVTITAAFPTNGTFKLASTVVQPGKGSFSIEKP